VPRPNNKIVAEPVGEAQAWSEVLVVRVHGMALVVVQEHQPTRRMAEIGHGKVRRPRCGVYRVRLDGNGYCGTEPGPAVVPLGAGNLQVIAQTGVNREFAGDAEVILNEGAPAVVLSAEVRRDFILAPRPGISYTNQETGHGVPTDPVSSG